MAPFTKKISPLGVGWGGVAHFDILLLLMCEGTHKMASFDWILEQERTLMQVQTGNLAALNLGSSDPRDPMSLKVSVT